MRELRAEFTPLVAIASLLWMALPAVAEESVRIGWIGSMTGPQQKWASYEAARLAFEEVNEAGGINGRPLEIIWEDGKGTGAAAAAAAQKLINVDKVKYIVGGHCTPESLAIAPIAEKAKVPMLASITSNPFLTEAGDYVFRLTAVSTVGAERVFEYAKTLGLKKYGIIYQESDYPRPQAEKFRDLALEAGFTVSSFDGILSEETDLRGHVTAVLGRKPEALYMSSLAPDFAIVLLRRLHEMRVKATLLGNENAGYAVRSAAPNEKAFFEGLVFAAARCDEQSPLSKSFFEKFARSYGGKAAPYGCYTAEAYDAIKLMAQIIGRCGEDPEQVKKCLYETKKYEGASGEFSIDKNGDVIRQYDLLQVRKGQIEVVAGRGG